MRADRDSGWFWGWFTIIAIVNVALIGVLIYLGIEAAQWIARQS